MPSTECKVTRSERSCCGNTGSHMLCGQLTRKWNWIKYSLAPFAGNVAVHLNTPSDKVLDSSSTSG